MNIKALLTNVKKDNLFNLYPDSTLIIQSDGQILDVNIKATNFFEYSRFGMVGESVDKYILDGLNKISRSLKNQETEIVAVVCASKAEKYGEITAYKDEEDEKIYLAIRDVTKKYAKQNALSSEFKVARNIIDEKNTYLVNASNEILSGLNSIESFSKALMGGVSGTLTAKQEKYVNIINKNAKELLYNLDKMFFLFKTESNLIYKTYKTFDIVNMLNDIQKAWNDLFKEKNIRFVCDFSNIAYRNVCLDPVLMQNIIDVLLQSSLKNTEVGGVTFTVSNPPQEFLKEKGIELSEDENIFKKYLLFEIKDTSAGLNDEEINSVFDPYKLIKNPQKRSMGTKFSYPAVKKLIEELDGTMWVNSKISNGVSVTFLLPAERKIK